MTFNHSIVAISTGTGGAISTIRISGINSIDICDIFFRSKSKKKLSNYKGFSLVYGYVFEGENIIDDVIISLFRAPNSYTGENMIEISCHASQYIQQKIIELCVKNGAEIAQGGEFTMRAYTNGKMDLMQSEAVADIIASSSAANHRLAMNQMRGGYTKEFTILRKELINLMSLMELELDFSEEDVEFADRTQLTFLLKETDKKITQLVDSFQKGNAIKNGVPVAIVGKPNTGKSTLLNTILNDDRAMVSPIAGTTRDVIEECIVISTTTFRFIDTAGIHLTNDFLENMGIERTMKSVKKASLILLLVEVNESISSIKSQITQLSPEPWQNIIILRNKIDLSHNNASPEEVKNELKYDCFDISAKENIGIEVLKQRLSQLYSIDSNSEDILISNMRHYELLSLSKVSLTRVIDGLSNNTPTDFLAQDLRETLHHIGSLTGDITSADILKNIFQNFCIGK